MQIIINGKSHTTSSNSTIPEVLTALLSSSIEEGIAVCVNREIIPRSQWESYRIEEGDHLEIVQATQGG